jgi:hypothetical protein
MDSILSFENRAKKRKNLNKNQVEKKIIRVEKAQYIENYKIKIEFTDKSSSTVDFENFFRKNPHPVHDKYKDLELFKQFKIESGNLVWGENWDLIFPVDQLYKGKIKV